MARPRKTELDYFPFDVVFFDDIKLFELNNEFGPLGEVIYLRLLCLIYKSKEGYYLKKDVDTIALIILKSIGTKWGRSKKFVAQVICQLAEFGLLDKTLLHGGIITSAGIQRRYLKATERRQTQIENYCLLSDDEIRDIRSSCVENTTENEDNATETGVNVTETPVNATSMPQSKSKNININKNTEVSKKESKAGAYGRKTYDEIIKDFVWYFFDESLQGDEYLSEYDNCENLEKALKEFVQLRASKSLLTNAGLEELLLQLDGYDTKNKIAMVRKATASGWTGFFPVKETKTEDF